MHSGNAATPRARFLRSSEVTYIYISFVCLIYSVKVTVSAARCLLQPISCSVAELPALSQQTPPGLSTPGLSRGGCTRSTSKPVLLRERTTLPFPPVCSAEVADMWCPLKYFALYLT